MKVWEYIWILSSQGEAPEPGDEEIVFDWLVKDKIEPLELLNKDSDAPNGHARNAMQVPKDLPLDPRFVSLVKEKYPQCSREAVISRFLDENMKG